MKGTLIAVSTAVLLSGCLGTIAKEGTKAVPGGAIAVDMVRKPDRLQETIDRLRVRLKRLENSRPDATCRSLRKQYQAAMTAKHAVEDALKKVGKSADELASRLEPVWQRAMNDMDAIHKRHTARPCPGILG